MSKLDQLKALGDAKRAARESSDGDGPKAIKAKAGSDRLADAGVAPSPSELVIGIPITASQKKHLARSSVVEQAAYNRQVAGSKPAAPTKRGRPRIGEQRDKPWLSCIPPMSKSTWYRRQKEAKT